MWKLKDEETAGLFTHEMAARNDEVTKADDIQKKWLLMKETWLNASKQFIHLDTRRLGGEIEMWKRKVCHKPGGNLNRLKINIL